MTLALLVLSTIALADIPPPRIEEDCVPGARQTLQARMWACTPTTCDADTDCESGETCREAALCVETRSVSFRRGGAPRKGVDLNSSVDVDMARATCADGACSAGTCQTAKRCVASSPPNPEPPTEPTPEAAPEAPSEPTPEPESAGWGCTTVPGTAGGLGAIALVLLAVARRRR